jgi:hypothetical protein
MSAVILSPTSAANITLIMQRLCRLFFAVIALASPAQDAWGAVERGTLHEISKKIVALYNGEDAAGLHALFTPALQQAWPIERFSERLADCRRQLGRLERVSLPVMGTRTYGFLAAYFETTGRDMFLEIDQRGLIKLLTFKGQNDICALTQPESAVR